MVPAPAQPRLGRRDELLECLQQRAEPQPPMVGEIKAVRAQSGVLAAFCETRNDGAVHVQIHPALGLGVLHRDDAVSVTGHVRLHGIRPVLQCIEYRVDEPARRCDLSWLCEDALIVADRPARPPWARELVGDLGDCHPHIGGINGQHARAASSEATATTSSSDNRRRSSGRGAIGFSSFAVLLYYAIANASAWTLGRRIIPAVGLVGCLVLAFVLPVLSVAVGAAVVAIGAAAYGFAAGRHKQVLDYSRRELSLG